MKRKTSLALTRKMPAGQAFVVLASDGLAAIEASLDHLTQRDDADDVHALRIAIRQLRARLWIFVPLLPQRVSERWKTWLRDLARAASPVRDWDVFLAETLQPALEREPGDPTLALLCASASDHRAAARETMLDKVRSFCTRPLPRMHADLLHVARLGTAPSARLGRFAEGRLDKPARTWRRKWKALAEPRDDDQELADLKPMHKLRIAGKRLRYAIEALGEALPPRYRERLLRKLVKRQGRLGRRLDGSIARRLLCECLEVPGEGKGNMPQASQAPPGEPSATISA